MMSCNGRVTWLVTSLLVGSLVTGTILPPSVGAHRDLATPQEKAALKAINRIYVEPLALKDGRAADASPIATATTARLRAVGYDVSLDAAEPHDVTVKVKCEQRKTWEGPVTSGGDADQPDGVARLWTGPACQITYRTASHVPQWRREVRGTATEAMNTQDGDKILADLAARLAEDPFPFLLAAEWGQSSRLLPVLDNPATTSEQRATIVALLGHMVAVDAIPALSRTLKEPDPALAQEAAIALGAIGHEDCIPVLLNQLEQDSPAVRLAAIRGLGRLAPLYPNSAIVPALLAQLPREPVAGQTEIVRALGTTTDRRILEPLRALNRTMQQQTRSDSSPESKDLTRALGQSLDQFDGVHTEE
jgi:hypothetical protein